MGLTILTPPQCTNLTTYAALKAELKLTSDTDQLYLESLIMDASAVIETHCRRVFARQQVQESHPGYGDVVMQLDLCPIAEVIQALYKSELITDYIIEDRERGWLRRDNGWQDTSPIRWFLTGHAMGGYEIRDFFITLWGGYLLPCDNRIGSYSVVAGDQSFNDASDSLPLLVAGDRLSSSNFLMPENNGSWVVVSCTAGKLIVSGGTLLVDEAASIEGTQVLVVSTLPRDVSRAALEAAKAWSFTRSRDPTVRTRRIAEMSYGYDLDQLGSTPEVLPPRALSLLRPWVREK